MSSRFVSKLLHLLPLSMTKYTYRIESKKWKFFNFSPLLVIFNLTIESKSDGNANYVQFADFESFFFLSHSIYRIPIHVDFRRLF